MADKDDTPAAPKAAARRAPRKPAAAKRSAATPVAAQSAAASPSVTTTPAAKPADAKRATAGASTTTATSKPRRKPAAAASAPAAVSVVTKKPSAPPKPRSSKRATPPVKRSLKPKPPVTVAEPEKKSGWKSKVAIAGGLAAVGAAATAALLSLRGSTPTVTPKPTNDDTPIDPVTTHAHAADGSDATKSFKAGIADENTIPE